MCNNTYAVIKDVVVVNELGLHARSAAKIAELAKKAKSKVWIRKDKEKVDAKSIIDMLTLGCERGSKIQVIIDDASDITILDCIVQLVANGFGE